MPFDDSRMTTRSKKPPMSTITAGLRNAPVAAAAGRRWRVSGQRIPAQTTPTSNRSPQKLSHTWRIGQSQAMKRIRMRDRKSTRLNSSHQIISYAVFCLKKKKNKHRKHDIITLKTNTLNTTSPKVQIQTITKHKQFKLNTSLIT